MRDATEIVVVIDKSGSMVSKASDVIGGFNGFVDEQRKIGGNANLSLVTFDTGYHTQYRSLPITQVGPLGNGNYVPGGGTALFDAIGAAISHLGIKLRSLPEEMRPANVVVVIMTDGEENSSKEYSLSEVNHMIKHQQEKYNWKFMFIGVGLEAFQAGATMLNSIPAGGMAAMPDSGFGVRCAFNSVSKSIGDVRNGTWDGTISSDSVTISSTGDKD